ncbi:type II secretion system F family protein [Alphaproteobacteria bacterium KMM 3653]|uniref:Type II secretion system F family protein n=1 Tax=Harenicola maris TaxID=2841044 RepID=A0AAP2CP90_9RHOB|nr:type II secretion system F family protein [Harenicola maris]
MEILTKANEFLVEKFGELGPLYAVGLLGVLLVVLTLPMFLKKEKDPFDKVRGQNGRGNRNSAGGETKKALRNTSGRAAKLEKFSNFLEPQDEGELSAAKLKMLQAGYRGKNAVQMYHFSSFALGLGALAVGCLVAIVKSATGEVTTQALIMTILIPAAVGYYLPRYWVNRRVQSRQLEITNGFPDALDMMLVCVEAGQSLDQSIIRVSGELEAGFPALAEEFQMVAHEMKAGRDKVSVLKGMSERAGVTDIASFVTVLVQSATFGTSIADALRVFADEMRDKRVMRAEEKANVLPTKLTLGTMMFTLPPLLIILIGPSIYQIYETLKDSTFF